MALKPDECEVGGPWEMEEEAMAIILRHRPDLQGKSFKEAREILKGEFLAKKAQLPKSDR